ncbi:uncharacterized protein MYCFIDRAFT_176448 [Pseudocercospora fijiensis CIRAD86]|uniref:Uncharacterized protein n=1 Tax=Pseudocercospora fijiensis (strain CIRAD86) TaxID=383855 RepID=M3A933_PSEFD|nr:uncharacterized protein MYCFIDRAFT_176448 [Pseudocercospora fijiensis CIRAD86]EME81136.1 hypothetical protein MYCFIDRAFT_176448 [Pseudocercospora fijiensis CIRAD86]
MCTAGNGLLMSNKNAYDTFLMWTWLQNEPVCERRGMSLTYTAMSSNMTAGQGQRQASVVEVRDGQAGGVGVETVMGARDADRGRRSIRAHRDSSRLNVRIMREQVPVPGKSMRPDMLCALVPSLLANGSAAHLPVVPVLRCSAALCPALCDPCGRKR